MIYIENVSLCELIIIIISGESESECPSYLFLIKQIEDFRFNVVTL